MARFKDFEVTSEALWQAKRLCGIRTNTERRVKDMARLAAPFTHPDGNKRYESYVFDIQNNRIVSMVPYDPRNPRVSYWDRVDESVAKHFGDGGPKKSKKGQTKPSQPAAKHAGGTLTLGGKKEAAN